MVVALGPPCSVVYLHIQDYYRKKWAKRQIVFIPFCVWSAAEGMWVRVKIHFGKFYGFELGKCHEKDMKKNIIFVEIFIPFCALAGRRHVR
jgi:hypothetical protein